LYVLPAQKVSWQNALVKRVRTASVEPLFREEWEREGEDDKQTSINKELSNLCEELDLDVNLKYVL
jgi:hypothetical protein